MKRSSPPSRYSVPKRGAAPTRKTRVKRTNPARAAKRFERAYLSPGFVDWVKSLACSVPGCWRTDIDCAHVDKPRSRGGRWFETAPLCGHDRPGHHQEQEKRTPGFNSDHGIDLYLIADAVALRWKAFAKDTT